MAHPDLLAFQPQEHLVQLEDGPYLPIQWRLVWFHEHTGPRAGYLTVEIAHDRKGGFARFFTVAWDGRGDQWRPFKVQGLDLTVCGRVATGEGSEEASHFPDYYEAAATKSLGRALEGLGFGTPSALEGGSPDEPDTSSAIQPSQITHAKAQRH